MRNRQRGSNLGLLLLASQVFQLGIDNIPPATLATLVLNVYLFLFPFKPILQTCVSVQQAYWFGDWHRLLLSPFHHVDDWHLYFNMVSFLWKGLNLERRLGTTWFAYLLSVFSLLTGLVYLLLEAGLTELMDDSSFSMQCAVGFSGVLFGLKVVNNHYNPGGVTYIMGFPVAKRYACWVELVLIHVMNPGTSFIGHLSGILVGLLYTLGPLKTLMKLGAGYSGYETPYTPNRTPYYGAEPSAPPQHSYTAGLSEQEQYEAAIVASLQDQGRRTHSRPSGGLSTNSALSIEEIRQRRLQRFDT
ncbi:Rhomboid-related protein 4 [Bagarius yarrelli]|uniref:Rhomboid-related protein 4 n=1 Tax=Bagarius yarrelli TaxID=175774 RepID=A0A556V785_BAGYA|nr:Rhomboid-related protein 4 [Bagarius yarrelli]